MSDTVKIEKQVWESTLKASMDRAGRIEILEQQLAIAEKYLDEISDAVEIYLSKENRTEEFTKDCLLGCGLTANQAKWEIKELDK